MKNYFGIIYDRILLNCIMVFVYFLLKRMGLSSQNTNSFMRLLVVDLNKNLQYFKQQIFKRYAISISLKYAKHSFFKFHSYSFVLVSFLEDNYNINFTMLVSEKEHIFQQILNRFLILMDLNSLQTSVLLLFQSICNQINEQLHPNNFSFLEDAKISVMTFLQE